MKSNIFNSASGAAVAIRRMTPGQSCRAAGAALLTLTLTMGISGCSHSKQTANSNQNSSTQNQAQVVAPAAPTVPVPTASQPDLGKKKSVKGPVKRLPANRTYTDQASGLSFTYPRKSTLEVGDKAEQDGLVSAQLPMEFVEEGGVTMAVVELPGIAKSGSDFTPALFAISANKDLSVDQCGRFAGEENADKANSESADKPAPLTSSSKLTIGGTEYVELDEQTQQGAVKYYHRFVLGATPDDNACYEFALSVKSAEQKQENDNTNSAQTSSTSDADHNPAFTKLEKILASVSIKGDKKNETVADTKTEPTKEDAAKDAKAGTPSAENGKTAVKLDDNPR
jgi:hypothetical protein